MVNDGKELENLVRLIQETLKDPINTIIYSNAKVKNNSGSKREIDILIEAKVNNFTLKIAIECKDYKSPISVEKIEAFKAKCDRIPDINKKVFVATNGYQKDAINAAKEFGITLYDVKEVDGSTVMDWLPVSQLGLVVTLENYQFGIISSEEEIDHLNMNLSRCSFIYNNNSVTDLNQFVIENLKENSRQIWDINIYAFMKGGAIKEDIGKITTIPFKIEFNNSAFIANNNDLKFPVGEMNGTVNSYLVEKMPDKVISKSFVSNEQLEAKYVAFENAKYGKMEMVITQTNNKLFHTSIDGKKVELKSLGVYDPKTDNFTPSNNLK